LKKIVIISPAYPLRGGIAAFGERLAQAFQQTGNKVIIYTFSLQYPNFIFPGKTQYSEDAPPKDLDIRVKINSIHPLNWWKVGSEIQQLNADVVLTMFWLPFMSPCLGTILRQVRKNKISKTIAIVHNIIPHEKRLGDRLLAKYFAQANDAFVALSDAVAKDMRHFTAQPVAVTPHPIYDHYGTLVERNEALSALNLDKNYRYILFFGFIRDYKGLDLLLEAMSIPQVKALPVKLIVAGEYYGNSEKYEKIIDKLAIKNQLVLHTFFIANEQIKHYFSVADLIVQPYRSATQSGISQVAYHFEKPMMVTNVGGLPEIVPHGEAGYVVEVNPAAIAEAIIDFYSNNKLDAFQEGLSKQKQKYSWDHMVHTIEHIIE
jgi:glycosyltransferase involved in cell wall biosynthesis